MRSPLRLVLPLLFLAGCLGVGAADQDNDGAPDASDCAPADPEVAPGFADPHGDDRDTDCDGADGIDRDGDGYASNAAVDSPAGRDCDDNDPSVNPGVADAFGDGLDANCDGADGIDDDGDGFASQGSGGPDCDDDDPALAVEQDADDDGVTNCEGDCDDNNALRFPGNLEACDGFDSDCDGDVSGEEDADLDGSPGCDDCDDDDPDRSHVDADGDGTSSCDGDCVDTSDEVSPLAVDLAGDGIDQNCDGLDGLDADGDGEASESSGGADCDDADPAITSATDADVDGRSLCDGDCDDDDPTVRPGIDEQCDGVDNDCDGSLLGELDGDGDGALACADCDDGDATRSPTATEVCDGVDQNCDGVVDEGFDADADGSTSCGGDCDDNDPSVSGLDADADGFSSCAGDCDDAIPSFNPVATDQFGDLLDQNCDGIDGLDADGDGEAGALSGGPDCDDGNAAISSTTDVDGDGVPLCGGDCDDADATRFVGAAELCNGIDDDCDGSATGEADGDGDGSLACADCADANEEVFPGAAELCDAVDNDCNGVVDDGFDADADGVTTCAGDCDDNDPTVRPGFFESCDGLDTDCDGQITNEADFDGDGYPSCGDCDDDNAAIHPTAEEVCNDLDDDCDTVVDPPLDRDGDGYVACAEDCDDYDVTPCEVVDLVAGGERTCALLDNGTVRCWGNATFGGLGYGSILAVGAFDTPASAGNVILQADAVALGMGDRHTCALLDDGDVRCWGDGSGGQLGYGHTSSVGDDEHPADAGSVFVGGTAVDVDAGAYASCAVLSGGALRCWGSTPDVLELDPEEAAEDNPWWGHGNYTTYGDNEPPALAGDVVVGGSVAEVAMGHGHTCARFDDGSVRCWGYGFDGRNGDPSSDQIVGNDDLPTVNNLVQLGGAAEELVAGTGHTCARLVGGDVVCWGSNYSGALGYGDEDPVGDDETPAQAGPVSLGAAAVDIDAGSVFTCAALVDGTVRCWGAGFSGRLGLGDTESIGDDELPTAVPALTFSSPAVQVACGTQHACARLQDGNVVCWGRSDFGQLGGGNTLTIGDDEPHDTGGPVEVSLPLP